MAVRFISLDKIAWEQICNYFKIEGDTYFDLSPLYQIGFELRKEKEKMAVQINEKFSYDGGDKTDGEFLGWIYARLNQVFGERPSLDYMQRFERIIDKMKDDEFYAEPQWTQENMEKLKHRNEYNGKVIHVDYTEYVKIYRNGKFIYSDSHGEIKEKKMTREEAKSKCHGIAYPEAFIQALEALGLIKFDEPKRKYVFFPHPDAGKDNVSVYQDDAVKTLKEYGYTIHDKHGIKL